METSRRRQVMAMDELFRLLGEAGRLPGQRDARGLWNMNADAGCQCAACRRSEKKHDSHCSVHNEPAYPNGPCDCALSKGDK